VTANTSRKNAEVLAVSHRSGPTSLVRQVETATAYLGFALLTVTVLVTEPGMTKGLPR